MATATATKMSKSAFLTGFLKKNPTANPTAVNEAWARAGYAGSVSRSLVGRLRTDLGLSGNLRPTTKVPVAPPAGKKSGPKKSAPASKGKSSFIKELLVDHPQANADAVNKAWRKAGMEGTISVSLVNNMRSKLGLAGNLRPAPKSAVSKRSAEEPSAGGGHTTPSPNKKRRPVDRERMLDEIEGAIDRLIFGLLEIGGMEKAQEALRAARRVVVRAQKP